jgi:hypothetical protein
MKRTRFEFKWKLRSIWPRVNVRNRRLMTTNEAKCRAYGGVSLIHRANGLSRKAIVKGMREISGGEALMPGQIRRPGTGRKLINVSDPELLNSPDQMIEGHPEGIRGLGRAGSARARG